MSAPNREVWDVELRPHRSPKYIYTAAFLIAAAHIAVALLLKVRYSGVIFHTSDQVAFVVLGLVVAGAVSLFARPRLRVGPAGLAVRNLFGYRLIPWGDVVGVSFPPGKRWARIDLPADEYVPLMAIQTADRERAVDAMDTVRSLLARYRPDPRDG